MLIEIKGVRFYNKGAEMMLLAVIEQLKARLPEARIAMAPTDSSQKTVALGIYRKLWKYRFGLQLGDFGILIPKSIRSKYNLVTDSEINAVLDISGFTYGDQGGPEKTILMSKESKKWNKAGKIMVLLPQSFGPFEIKENRSSIISIAENVDLIYARDKVSYDYLRKTIAENQKNKVFLSPDITILLKGEVPSYFDPNKHQVAIIPNNKMLAHTSKIEGENYKKFISYVIKRLEEKNYKPFILLHDQKDVDISEIIQAEMGKKVETVVEDNPRLNKGLIANCRAVVGSRFHGLVSSLSQGVPTLGAGWSHKYQCLFDDYGCGENLIDMKKLDIELIDDRIDSVLDPEKNASLKTKLRHSAEQQKKKVEEMWDAVIELLKSGTRNNK